MRYAGIIKNDNTKPNAINTGPHIKNVPIKLDINKPGVVTLACFPHSGQCTIN